MVRRSGFNDDAVTYAAIGGTRAADLMYYPPEGYRPVERSRKIGSGVDRFRSATTGLMTWGVQRASGIRVTEITDGPGELYRGIDYNPDGSPRGMHEASLPESDSSSESVPVIRSGTSAVLLFDCGPFHYRAPVRVVYVIEEESRCGFAYGTLPGHPSSGEEVFVVEHRGDDTVWFTFRAFTRPAGGIDRVFPYVLRTVHTQLIHRYLMALTPVRAV